MRNTEHSEMYWLVLAFFMGTFVPAASGRLTIERPVYDFGTTYNTLPIMREFTLRNTGTSVLEIEKVDSECDLCLRFALERYEVAPGEAVALHVELDPAGMVGDISKSLTIVSRTPNRAVHRVTMRGQLRQAYTLNPRALRFTLSPGEAPPPAQMVTLVPSVQLHGVLQRVVSADERLYGTVEPGPEPGSYLARIHCRTTWPAGSSNADVHFYSDHSADPVGQISVQIYKPADVIAIPQRLVIERMNRTQTRSLVIKANKAGRLEGLTASHPAIQWKIGSGAKPGDYRVSVFVGILKEFEDFQDENLQFEFSNGSVVRVPIAFRSIADRKIAGGVSSIFQEPVID